MLSWMVMWHVSLSVIIIPFGIMIHKKLYRNIKNEEHLEKGKVIQRIIKTYSIIQCFLWPLCLILSTPFLDNNILNKFTSEQEFYLIQISRFISTFLRHYAGFHSLILALCRYVFIVFDTKAEKIGIKKLRSFFINCSMELPLLITICEFLFFPARDWISHFRVFNETFQNVTNQDLDLAQDSVNPNFEENVFYRAIQRYIPLLPINIIKCVIIIIATIIYSNVAEGLLYGHIFFLMKR